MNTQLSDITLHIDETLDVGRRTDIMNRVRTLNGVSSVLNPNDRPHLSVIRYDANQADAYEILETVRKEGVHAELIGL